MNTAPARHQSDNPSYPSYDDAEEPRRKAGLIVAVGALIALIVLLAGGLLVLHGSSTPATATLASASSPSVAAADAPAATASASSAAGAVDPGATATKTGTGASAGNTGGAPAPAPKPAPPAPAPKPSGPAPAITHLTMPDNNQVDCHNGNHQTFSFDWTTTNAVKVNVSIDGAAYKSFPANGNGSLPFNCTSAHTYKVTAVSQDGQSVTKSVTLTGRNVQKPSAPGDDE